MRSSHPSSAPGSGGKARRGEYPSRICDRRATPPRRPRSATLRAKTWRARGNIAAPRGAGGRKEYCGELGPATPVHPRRALLPLLRRRLFGDQEPHPRRHGHLPLPRGLPSMSRLPCSLHSAFPKDATSSPSASGKAAPPANRSRPSSTTSNSTKGAIPSPSGVGNKSKRTGLMAWRRLSA